MLAIVVVGFAVAVLAHRPLLAAFYRGLLWQDPVRPVSYVVLLHSDPATVDHASELFQQGLTDRILVLERRPPRVVEIGILPSVGETVRQDLQADNIPAESVEVITTDAVTHWQSFRHLQRFMHRDEMVAVKPTFAVLYPEHQTRYLRSIIDRTVPTDDSRQIHVWGCSPGSFGAASWWQQRGAIVKVAVAYLRLVHSLGFGEGDFNADNWSLPHYERSLGIRPSAQAAAA